MSAWFHNNIPDMDKEVAKSGGFMWFHAVSYCPLPVCDGPYCILKFTLDSGAHFPDEPLLQ